MGCERKFLKICTLRFLWDATANAKIHRRYFISKIFFDLKEMFNRIPDFLILENNTPRDILKFLSQDSRECYRKRYRIRHRRVENLIRVHFIVF